MLAALPDIYEEPKGWEAKARFHVDGQPRLLLYDLWDDPFTRQNVNARYPEPVEQYVVISETGDIAPEVLARLPEGKCAFLSGAGQADGAAEALMRLALRNYPADKLCVVGLRTLPPGLDVSAPGRVTTWLLPGHPGDKAAVAALGDAFDLVLVAKGDDLVAALRSEVEGYP